MILRFHTKLHSDYSRDYLIFDTEKKLYATFPDDFPSDEYFFITSYKKIRQLIRRLDKEGYIRKWTL